jgi:CheY-like chemotaxis protein
MHDDDLMILSEDSETSNLLEDSWHILVVDDDDDVHMATEFSLMGAVISGRPLRFTHSRSAQEAILCLQQQEDIDLVLLDMVMERPDSGLEVARWLREEANKPDIPTIVLRSGQPGMLAKADVLNNRHINAFIEKQHATRSTLLALLTQHLRR